MDSTADLTATYGAYAIEPLIVSLRAFSVPIYTRNILELYLLSLLKPVSY